MYSVRQAPLLHVPQFRYRISPFKILQNWGRKLQTQTLAENPVIKDLVSKIKQSKPRHLRLVSPSNQQRSSARTRGSRIKFTVIPLSRMWLIPKRSPFFAPVGIGYFSWCIDSQKESTCPQTLPFAVSSFLTWIEEYLLQLLSLPNNLMLVFIF